MKKNLQIIFENSCWDTLMNSFFFKDSQYVSMKVSMKVSMYKTLALFKCIFPSNIQNLTKFCMNINIIYAVILKFRTFNLRGQAKVAYINMCKKHHFVTSFISISRN